MTMKGNIIYILMGIALSFSAMLKAQQVPLFTQYSFNNFVFNPAIAGTYNYYQIRTNTRVQWVGVPDHPITNFLSVYGPSKGKDMGFGGYVFNDVTGPTSRSGFSLAYAYNIAVQEDVRLSMGMGLGLLQYKMDGANIELWDEHTGGSKDPLKNAMYSKAVPDASIGVYLYSYTYHIGISSVQLLNNKLSFFDVDTLVTKGAFSRLKSHFYLTGGYKYFIDKKQAIEPTLLIKAVGASPLQFELSTRYIYKETFWGGLSIRSSDAFSILIGYIHEKQYFFGYSYDFGVSAFRKYNNGTHEITIGYRFNELK